jgi:hypothetical protein
MTDSLAQIIAELRSDHPFAERNEFAQVLVWADRLERIDAQHNLDLQEWADAMHDEDNAQAELRERLAVAESKLAEKFTVQIETGGSGGGSYEDTAIAAEARWK